MSQVLAIGNAQTHPGYLRNVAKVIRYRWLLTKHLMEHSGLMSLLP